MTDDDLDEIKTKLAKIEATISYIATSSEKELQSHSEKLSGFDERLRAAETSLSSKTTQIQTIEKFKDDITKIGSQVQKLENWRWFIIGGITVLLGAIYYVSNIIISIFRSSAP